MRLPLIFSFWFTIAAYVVHVIDESLLGGSFVEKVREHWWPEYSWRQFFWFNAAYFAVMIASVVVYDFRRGARAILPLLARGMGDSFSRIFARIGFEHFDVDEFLFHPAVHAALGSPWAGNLGAGVDCWRTVYRVSGVLHTSCEGREQARALLKFAVSSIGQFHFQPRPVQLGPWLLIQSG
jgi:hypothetical protein